MADYVEKSKGGTSFHISKPLEFFPESQSQDNDRADTAATWRHVNANPRNMSKLAWVFAATTIYVAIFLNALDNTIVADIQAQVVSDLGEIPKLSWVTIGYPLGGKVYDHLDVKLTFIICILFFEVGSAVCGAAPNMNAFIIGRCLGGVGAAGMYMGSLILLTAFTTIEERPAYISLTALAYMFGTVLGPIIGGAFAVGRATWRWAFYINLCICALAAPGYLFLIPRLDREKTASFTTRLKQLDYVGIVLIIGAYSSLLMAISFGGTVYAWQSGQIIGLFVCTSILWITFAIQQTCSILTTSSNRIFPLELLKLWEIDLLATQAAAVFAIIFLPLYYIPLFFNLVRGDSALEAGIRLLPFVFLNVFASLMNGIAMRKYGYYMPWFLFTGLLSVVAGALFFTVDVTTSSSTLYGYSVLAAIASGATGQAAVSVAQAKVQPAQVLTATRLLGFAQMTGVTISRCIANAIFANRAIIGIRHVLPTATHAEVEAAVSGARSTLLDSLDVVTRSRVLEVIVSAINDTYAVFIATAVLVVLLSFAMKREKLFGTKQKDQAANEGPKTRCK